jgi:lactoylglutathione lyase
LGWVESAASALAKEASVSVDSGHALRDFDPAQWVWGTDDKHPRFLHTMIRVREFERALRFYVDGLGMKVLTRFSVPVRRVDAMFIGYADYAHGGMLELVRPWDHEGAHTHGTGYGHIAIGAPDIHAMVTRLVRHGGELVTSPTVLIAGGPHVAFVRDLDGYSIELIETCRS